MDDQKALVVLNQVEEVPSRISKVRDGFSRNEVVQAFAHAFTMIGGVQRLALWANANPDKFYPLYSKLLPSTAIQIGDNANVTINHALPPTELDEHPDVSANDSDGGGIGSASVSSN